MNSVVCLEMGQLVVRLVTPRVGAAEGFLPGLSLARRSPVGWFVGVKALRFDDQKLIVARGGSNRVKDIVSKRHFW